MKRRKDGPHEQFPCLQAEAFEADDARCLTQSAIKQRRTVAQSLCCSVSADAGSVARPWPLRPTSASLYVEDVEINWRAMAQTEAGLQREGRRWFGGSHRESKRGAKLTTIIYRDWNLRSHHHAGCVDQTWPLILHAAKRVT